MTSVAAQVLRRLWERDETLAVAESLTGGLVAAELTGVPGASRCFRGSVTAYATVLKRDVLGVDAALLAERGAVDPDVAVAMAAGVRRALGADWGIVHDRGRGTRAPRTGNRSAPSSWRSPGPAAYRKSSS
ncbi:nicotinamide-nucleotide amidase [Streptomyces sp. DpondAA-F4a]|nr:nicotinamide-nucleotide amidase [Streptomyces sp. DpondAA-F4a]